MKENMFVRECLHFSVLLALEPQRHLSLSLSLSHTHTHTHTHTPWVNLECNPEIPVATGVEHGVSEHNPR